MGRASARLSSSRRGCDGARCMTLVLCLEPLFVEQTQDQLSALVLDRHLQCRQRTSGHRPAWQRRKSPEAGSPVAILEIGRSTPPVVVERLDTAQTQKGPATSSGRLHPASPATARSWADGDVRRPDSPTSATCRMATRSSSRPRRARGVYRVDTVDTKAIDADGRRDRGQQLAGRPHRDRRHRATVRGRYRRARDPLRPVLNDRLTLVTSARRQLNSSASSRGGRSARRQPFPPTPRAAHGQPDRPLRRPVGTGCRRACSAPSGPRRPPRSCSTAARVPHGVPPDDPSAHRVRDAAGRGRQQAATGLDHRATGDTDVRLNPKPMLSRGFRRVCSPSTSASNSSPAQRHLFTRRFQTTPLRFTSA